MIQRWQVQSNVAVHGIAWTAKYLAKKGYCFALAYWLIIGKAPRKA
jgi:hypothetical protein